MPDNLQRFGFFEVFQQNPDGSLTPKISLHLNGITFGPGVSFSRGVVFGGIDFFQFFGKPIAGTMENGVLIVKGFYNF